MYNYCAACNSVTEHKKLVENNVAWVLCNPCEIRKYNVDYSLARIHELIDGKIK